MPVTNRMITMFSAPKEGKLNVFPYRCAVMRNRNASCTRCVDSCTTGALSIEGANVQFDAQTCVVCGTCAVACPTKALEATRPGDDALRGRVERSVQSLGSEAVFMCDVAWATLEVEPCENAVARVKCLGRVDVCDIVEAVALGADNVSLVHGNCDECPRHAGREACEGIAARSRRLLEVCGCKATVAFADELPQTVFGELGEAEPKLPLLAMGCTVVPAEEVDWTKTPLRSLKSGHIPQFVPDARERLLDTVAILCSEGMADLDAPVDEGLWTSVAVDAGKCRTCLACARFCPTGAMRPTPMPDGTYVLEHMPADCVACGDCVDVCPGDAVTFAGPATLGDVLEGRITMSAVLPAITDGRGGAHSMYKALGKYVNVKEFYE